MVVNAAPAFAGAYQAALTQYAHASWRIQDGEFDGEALSITQTRDGYLWVGTEGGLRRYDGSRFQQWDLPVQKTVYSLLADRDGSLWVGRTNDLVRLGTGQPAVSIKTVGRVNGLYQDKAGAIWLAQSRAPAQVGGLCKVDGAAPRCFGVVQRQPCDYANVATQDQAGLFWIGGAAGVCTWRPGAKGETLTRGGNPAESAAGALTVESDGSVLIGYHRPGQHLGLEREAGGVATPFAADGVNGEDLQVSALLRDRDGALWIGTADAGLYHIDQGRTDHFTRADGLSGNSVNALFQDREGCIWVATAGGLDRFHARPIVAVTSREGLQSDHANSVLVRSDGSVWVGSAEGLSIIRDGVAVPGSAPGALAGHAVTSMAEDHAGHVWLGLDDDLLVLDGVTPRSIRKADGGKLGALVGLAADAAGDMWALATGRPYRLYRIHKGTTVEEVLVPGNTYPHRLAAGPDGAIWVADLVSAVEMYQAGHWVALKGPDPTASFSKHLFVAANGDAVLSTQIGAYYLRGAGWTRLDAARGLPCDDVSAGIVDQAGALWLRGQCGMMVIAAPELQRALNQPSTKLTLRLLDAVDGAQPGETAFQPAVAASRNGQLWFAIESVLLTVNPAQLSSNTLPPPVHIEQVVADHRTYSVGRAIRLPPLTRDVEISYSGLSLVAPQKVRYRYRLSGVDIEWQDVGARRAAFYMNLRPGSYRFQVTASNNDGVWNDAGDVLEFSIRPAFYQTLWFRLTVVILLLGLACLGLQLRVRNVTAEIEARLSERQAERMRIARELHDTLLQGFQGLLMRFQVVADAIPKRSPAKSMMEAVLSRAEEVLIEGRDRVHDLRSVETGPLLLVDDLQRMTLSLEQDGCGPIEVRCTGTPRTLDSAAQQEILAIAKEALTNACRHARATEILCHVTFSGLHVRLCCEDNGIGIDAATIKAGGRAGHWGLVGMRERARQAGGVLSVQSTPGHTRIAFSLNTGLADLRRLFSHLISLGVT